MTTPLLLMTEDNDGTVYWHQSVELYTIARRAKKAVVLLVYNGEDHGLRQKKNHAQQAFASSVLSPSMVLSPWNARRYCAPALPPKMPPTAPIRRRVRASRVQ